MGDVRFAKMHGAGNDFIMIDDRAGAIALSRDAIASLCSRRRGIGGDGLIMIGPSRTADFSMRYFNSDGGEAALCGNGTRCAAAFARAEGIAGDTMTFETRAGLMRASIMDGDAVRVGIADVADLRLRMRVASCALPVNYGVCGVPHAVVIDAAAHAAPREEFLRFARAIRNDPAFGESGANVNVVTVAGRRRFRYRTFERGVEDETDACGTGSVVIAAVLAHLGLGETPLAAETAGGDILEIDLVTSSRGAERCLLTGPAVFAFRGAFRLEEYERS